MVPSQKPMREAILQEEARIARLGAELAEAHARLTSLQEELTKQPAASRDSLALVPSVPVPSTVGRKGGAVPVAVPRPRRPLSEALDQRPDRSQRIRARLCK